MSLLSKDPTPGSVNLAGVERHYQQLEGFTVSFETFHNDIDTIHMFRGMAGDACQAPHWGVVQRGRVVFRYGDQEEAVTAGQAYYARPGHTAWIDAGTEIIQFTPNEPLAEALNVSVANLVDALSDPGKLAERPPL